MQRNKPSDRINQSQMLLKKCENVLKSVDDKIPVIINTIEIPLQTIQQATMMKKEKKKHCSKQKHQEVSLSFCFRFHLVD